MNAMATQVTIPDDRAAILSEASLAPVCAFLPVLGEGDGGGAPVALLARTLTERLSGRAIDLSRIYEPRAREVARSFDAVFLIATNSWPSLAAALEKAAWLNSAGLG